MSTPTLVTLLVPLHLPLDLVNEIERESRRSGLSIPEMLTMQIIDAAAQRELEDFSARPPEDLNTNAPFQVYGSQNGFAAATHEPAPHTPSDRPA